MPPKNDSSGKSGREKAEAGRDGASAKKKRAGKKKVAPPLVDNLLMKALGHEGRVRCLAVLNERVASPNELSKELEEGLSQVSYHVKVLREYGLIELDSTEPRRGAIEHYYRAVEHALIPDGTWKNLPKKSRKAIYADVLQALYEDITAAVDADTFDARDDFHLSWTPMILDEKGWKDSMALLNKTLNEMIEIQIESSERTAESGDDDKREVVVATVGMLGFESTRNPKDGLKAPARKRN